MVKEKLRGRGRQGGAKKKRKDKVPLVTAVVVGLGAILLLFGARARHVGSIDEDAYISFRYARNLLRGDGLVFNPSGERVEGITNLLWTLAVSAGSWLSGLGLPTVAEALGVVCGALILLLVYRWCRVELLEAGISRTKAALAALAAPSLLVLAPGFAFYSASGLEVSLFALLLTGGLYALSRAESPGLIAAGSLLLGLAAMTRPEGTLVLAAGAAACVLRPGKGGRRLVAGILPGLAGLSAITLWRLLYYGSPVPNTAFAKAGGFVIIEQWGWPYLVDAALGNWFPVAWLLLLAGAFLDRGFLVRNLATLALVPAWSAYVVYTGGDYMPSHRFLVPILPVLYVLAVPSLVRSFGALPFPSAGLSRLVRATAVGLPLTALAALFILQVPGQLAVEEYHKTDSDEETEYRRAIGEWFEIHDPDALVAANAVGTVGYYSDVRIVDMLGLNDSHIARHGHKEPEFIPGHQAGDGEYVLSREPDYIILWSIEPEYRFVSDRELANSPEFHAEYEPIKVELENGYELSMFRR